MRDPDCPLCFPDRHTEWIDDLPPGFEDFNVFRCDTDGAWMIVSKHHGDWLLGEREKVEQLRDILFPTAKGLRFEMRKIPGHAHAHLT